MLQEASGTAGWTRHDGPSRTGATMLGDMGELPDIIEAALNHVSIRRCWRRPTTGAATARRWRQHCSGWLEAGAAKVVQLRGDV